MTSYLLFAGFIFFIIYIARPTRKDKVYHAEEEVKDEISRHKEESL